MKRCTECHKQNYYYYGSEVWKFDLQSGVRQNCPLLVLLIAKSMDLLNINICLCTGHCCTVRQNEMTRGYYEQEIGMCVDDVVLYRMNVVAESALPQGRAKGLFHGGFGELVSRTLHPTPAHCLPQSSFFIWPLPQQGRCLGVGYLLP